jgi:hypothetical protein
MDRDKDGIVIIDDQLRVQISSDCLTLQIYQGVNNKDGKEIWTPEGYYTSWEGLFNGLVRKKLDKQLKNRIVTLKEMVTEFRELKKEIQKILKEFM